MAELYSNNAVGTLVSSILDTDTSLELADEPWAANFVINNVDGDFQRATLTGDDPLTFEIVYITFNDNTRTLTVLRGQEWTDAQAWPAGTKLSARVTAGMLNSFVAQSPGATYGTVLVPGYPILPIRPASPTLKAGVLMYQDLGMAREAVGGSITVSLGDSVTKWKASTLYLHGSVVAPLTPDGYHYALELNEGMPYSSTETAPSFPGTGDTCEAYSGVHLVGRWVPVPTPLDFTITLAHGLVVTEVGFICTDYGASTAPVVSIGTTAAPGRFAMARPLSGITAYGDVHRIAVTANGTLANELKFSLDTAASGLLVGRFYWRGFFVQMP